MKKLISSLFLILASTAHAQTENSGEFLALRQAFFNSDDMRVREYLDVELSRQPDSPALLEEAILSSIYHLDSARANDFAAQLRGLGNASIAVEVSEITHLMREGRFLEAANYLKNDSYLQFIAPEIIQAWADVQAGNVDKALHDLQATAEQARELGFIFKYQIAMIEAYANKNYQGAAEILAGTSEPIYMSDLSYYSHIALRKLSSDPSLDAELEKQFGKTEAWPSFLVILIDKLEAGQIDPSLNFVSPQNAIGEYLGALLASNTGERFDYGVERLLKGMIPTLAPKNAWFLRDYMNYFNDREEYEDVIHFANQVHNDSFLYPLARQDKINAMMMLDQFDASREAVEAVDVSAPNDIAFHADIYRRFEDYQKAAGLYEQALAISGRENARFMWPIYGLAISYERMGEWKKAENAFLEALNLEPENADVLNYLGYSYVDRGEKLDTGLKMIEKAVRLAPQEWQIIDSLGWAYFKLGRYDDALIPLERATAMKSDDAILNTHLGDLYWKLGRKREARYQWERSTRLLEEDTKDLTLSEIQQRLENGLGDD